tara:strand:+ start:5014 stop:6054 length:1041 start_codon:yes stop_codon:yes gene_type:complete
VQIYSSEISNYKWSWFDIRSYFKFPNLTMKINIEKKYFSFFLKSSVQNSREKIFSKKGWIIKLTVSDGKDGYGEISPLNIKDLSICRKQIKEIPNKVEEQQLKDLIKNFHPCLQSGINIALAEINGIIKYQNSYDFRKISQTAILLNPAEILEEFRKINKFKKIQLTIKWKVGINPNLHEEKILEKILSEINNNIRFRIDANGSWNRTIGNRWAEILKGNKNLDWIEQPIDCDDIEGLKILNKKVPVALDESLIKNPQLINNWKGWQIRRPSQESDPIKLFYELNNKLGYRSISTSFETGIGSRMLYHFSLLQQKGLTPKVPGLALQKIPNNFLFSNNPELIWQHL